MRGRLAVSPHLVQIQKLNPPKHWAAHSIKIRGT